MHFYFATGESCCAPQLSVRRGKKSFAWSYDEKGAFIFSGCGQLPPNAWSQILTNGSFGCLMTEAGTGHIWHIWVQNTRENRLVPWMNDSLHVWGTERLEIDGHSAFAALDGLPYRVGYGLGYASWEKCGARVTAFVPPGRDCRILWIQCLQKEPLNVRCRIETERGGKLQENEDGILAFKNAEITSFLTLNSIFRREARKIPLQT